METNRQDQRDGGIRRILTLSWAYEAFQHLVGNAQSYEVITKEFIRSQPGNRVLDVGCGTAEIRKWLPGAEYDGFDPNPKYVAAARSQMNDGRVWEGSIDTPRLEHGDYDLVLGLGVLHHVNDTVADRFFELASNVVADDGRVITVDPCRYPGQSRSSRFMVGRDRGAWVRAPEEYQSLAAARFARVRVTVRDDLLRIPYSHAILEVAGTKQT